jgi:hypothetical protein
MWARNGEAWHPEKIGRRLPGESMIGFERAMLESEGNNPKAADAVGVSVEARTSEFCSF